MDGLQLPCVDEASVRQFAETLSLALRPGDLVTLSGELGAGKTTLARALIRNAAGDDRLEVPSPTFTLVQTYKNLPFGDLAHMDLYRLEDGNELDELGVDEALEDGVVLVEWPQMAQAQLPPPSLELNIESGETIEGEESRRIVIHGTRDAVDRVKRSLAIRQFLADNGHVDSTRQHLTGDASARRYESITPRSGLQTILMNSPGMPDGPPIRDGLPYSKIANLAENVSAFVGVAKALEEQGLRVPRIHACDVKQGLLLIEDLGRGGILSDQGQPLPDRYLAAVSTLAKLHEKTWVSDCPLPDGSSHTILPFDRQAMLIETDLLPQWYAPYRQDAMLNDGQQQQFDRIWNSLIDRLKNAEQSLILRDFHSPNIIWIDKAKGDDRIGLIDFQDAVTGPTAYDLASIAQDARVDISENLEGELMARYCETRAQLDEDAFKETYAIMCAQRATKLLGIFVRLSRRDGKHVYLSHLPRIETYLWRALAHPVLEEYRIWVETVLKK